jgi:hypothetical protein
MGYPNKVQLIQRKDSQQWYINLAAAIALGMDFSKGEDIEWTIADKGNLILSRKKVPPNRIALKKLPPPSRTRKPHRRFGNAFPCDQRFQRASRNFLAQQVGFGRHTFSN